MAPNVKISTENKYKGKKILRSQNDNKTVKKIKKIKEYINNNSEDVGTRFAEEARKIYYGEKKARAIRGVSTREETKSLNEEGVPFLSLPWGSREDA